MQNSTKKFLAGSIIVLAVLCMVLGGIGSGIILMICAAFIYAIYEIRDLLNEILNILKEKK